VISQMEWISRRTPPPLRRALFDTLVPIFAEYSQETIAAALRDGNKGVTAQRLCTAVSKREFGSFVRTLAGRPGSSNPVIKAAYHLRHSGVRHTALLVGRYVRRELQGSQVVRVVSPLKRFGGDSGQQDVMFGLMVVQQHLRGMEDRLAEMEGLLVDVEHRLGELNAPSAAPSGVDEQGRYRISGLDRLDDPVGRG
jgi:hypothetical protein